MFPLRQNIQFVSAFCQSQLICLGEVIISTVYILSRFIVGQSRRQYFIIESGPVVIRVSFKNATNLF